MSTAWGDGGEAGRFALLRTFLALAGKAMRASPGGRFCNRHGHDQNIRVYSYLYLYILLLLTLRELS